ncbi:MAG: hypothetical protein INR73_25350 [Williamsia sp.]|nr:hypothetical protein [Williamsia sp.]
MKQEILSNLNNPAQLERLYRTDKPAFKQAFNALYPEHKDSSLTSFWNERLNFVKEEISWGTSKDLAFVIVASLLAGLIAKLPFLLHIDEELFYTRNAGFVVFPFLSAFFAWKNKLSAVELVSVAGAFLFGIIFINYLPYNQESDSIVLSCIHLLLILWFVTGFAFVDGRKNNLEKRLGYLRFNGDLLVMTALIVIAGGLMTGITLGLFSLIGFNIEKFYFSYVVIFGLPAAPLLGTYLTQTNPQLVGKVSPVIARIFSPLVLVMLVIYLVAILFSGKNPYNDREFLLIFNALLVGVMAIVFFSVAEASKTAKTRVESWILFLLAGVTILVNAIALSAIVFRIAEWGLTPNRAAVLGSNTLIFINLLWVTVLLLRAASKKGDVAAVGKAIAYYLPVYFIWALIVTFLFPFLFGFK